MLVPTGEIMRTSLPKSGRTDMGRNTRLEEGGLRGSVVVGRGMGWFGRLEWKPVDRNSVVSFELQRSKAEISLMMLKPLPPFWQPAGASFPLTIFAGSAVVERS